MTATSLILIQHEFISIAEFSTPVQIKTVDDIPDCKLTIIDNRTGARFFRFFAIRLDQEDTARYDSTAVLRLAFAELVHQVLGEGDRWHIDGLTKADRELLWRLDHSDRAAGLVRSSLVADLTSAMSPALPIRFSLNREGISVLASGHFRRSVDLKIAIPEHDHHPRVSTNNSRNLDRQARSFDWPVRMHGRPAVMYLTHYRDMTPTGGYHVNRQALGRDIVTRFNALFPFIKEPLELVDGDSLTHRLDVVLNHVEAKPEPEVRCAIRYGVYRHVDHNNNAEPFGNWPAYQFAEVWEDHPLIKKFARSFHTDQVLLFDPQSLTPALHLPNGHYSIHPVSNNHELAAESVDAVVDDYLSIINTQRAYLFTFRPHDKSIGDKRWSMGQVMEYCRSHSNEYYIMRAALQKETVVMCDEVDGVLSIDGLALL